jgi:hypothetical protein
MTRLTNLALWLVSALVALQHLAAAATIDVDTVLGPNHPYPDQTITVVDGANPPTDLTILEGAGIGNFSGGPPVAVGLDLYGSSRAHMLGGAISGFPHNVLLHDRSVFQMDAGSLDLYLIEARDDSSVILNGGDWWEVQTYDFGRVRVNGGNDNATFTVKTFGESHAALNSESLVFIADELSTAVINSGNYDLAYARGSSEVLVNGGHFTTGMSAFDNAILRIRDIDSISEEYVDISNNAIAHVYGTNLRFEVSTENRPLVRGTWPDGGNFAFRYRLHDQGQIILHEVPEPTTAPLLAIAATALTFTARRSFWRRSQLNS